MKLYFAPLEGVAGYVFRNAFNDLFGGADKLFSPFLAPSENKKFTDKELRDILPDNNKEINLVPQLLTNNSKHFTKAAKQIKEMGYNEVNLNAGCPSGTVVSKGKGAGVLDDTYKLDKFLDGIFENLDMTVSIKTRIGLYESYEFEDIMQVYNKYPFSEVIVHPRTRVEMYKGKPDMKAFKYAYENSISPICYNGDIKTIDDYKNISDEFKPDSIMIGRGIIINPNLCNEIKGADRITVEQIKRMHDRIYNDYKEIISGDINILFKMKELWSYMSKNFNEPHKCFKLIKKAQNLYKYDIAVEEIFCKYKII